MKGLAGRAMGMKARRRAGGFLDRNAAILACAALSAACLALAYALAGAL